MTTPYTQPQFNSTSFNCPHCKAFSSMEWNDVVKGFSGREYVSYLRSAHCTHCRDYSLWISNEMIYPSEITVDFPSEDLPKDIKNDYLEAANILSKSPRGASALLRLAIEKLVNHLGAEGKDLDKKIGFLVSKGLNSKVQKSLDVVRVVGNNAVHPGQIDLTDDQETAEKLFRLVNIITNEMITEPNDVNEIYEELVPEVNKEGIEQRDGK